MRKNWIMIQLHDTAKNMYGCSYFNVRGRRNILEYN